MRHLGTQTYKTIVVNDEAIINKSSFLDKLNVPFHRPLDGAEFGDLFIENNQLNVTNNENNIIPLLDLNNSDVIKSLLLTETVFDDFFNFNKEFENTGSFNTTVDIGTDLVQININITKPATITTNTINITLADTTEAESLFLRLLEFNQNNCHIRTSLYDGTTTDTYMVYYNNVTYTTGTNLVKVILDSPINATLLSDITNTTIETITINSFNLTDTTVVNNYIELPNHYHTLNDLSDLSNNTNTTNGYPKLIDSTMSFDFNSTIEVDTLSIKNSLLTKQYSKDIQSKLNFDLLMTDDVLDFIVNYTDTTIDLGAGQFLIEYDYNNIEINNDKTIELLTKDKQGITTTKQFSITDTTTHENSYLVEYIKFDFNQLVGQNTPRVIDLLDVSLAQVDKTTIEDPQLKIYSITDTTITVIASYYELSIVQPNATTPPSVITNTVNLLKDDDGYIQLSVPKLYTNIIGTKHISIPSQADLYFTFDNTTFPITLTISSLDLVQNDWETHVSLTLAQEQQKYVLPRGRYKITSDTILNKYNIKMFINQ